MRLGLRPAEVLEFTPAQVLLYERTAQGLAAEGAMLELNNLLAAIGAAFSKEGGEEMKRWRRELRERAQPKEPEAERMLPRKGKGRPGAGPKPGRR